MLPRIIKISSPVADEHYVALTQADQPGETVHLIGEEIRRFADTCLAVIAGLETALLPNATIAPASRQGE